MGDTIGGWVDWPIAMPEAVVLDIERLILKDLIGETIGDLAVLSGDCNKVSALQVGAQRGPGFLGSNYFIFVAVFYLQNFRSLYPQYV